MHYGHLLRPALASAIAVFAVAAAQPVQAPKLIALSTIEQGEWQLRDMDAAETDAPRKLCVSDPGALLQLRHGTVQCSRFVIADEAETATVHYTCPGAGHGRTTITVETARLIKIDTQGVANGAPFDFNFEGRRLGDCPAAR